jgi:catechol 2,3-dioxygenase
MRIPEETRAASTGERLGDRTRLGPVHLIVTDLERSIGFYRRSIGLIVHDRKDGEGRARLGAGGEDLVVLIEDRDARQPGADAGLYHFALLHPSREALARAAQRLAATRTPISGASDHGFSEAIYLADPDGIGIELYADRSREEWPPLDELGGQVAPQPLDLRGLLAMVGEEEPSPETDRGLLVGHVHLHVGDIEAARAFYRDVIGFEETITFANAVFLAAGGYHHHLAFNLWRGSAVPPAPPAGVVGLEHWTILVESAEEVAGVRERAESAGVEHSERDGGLFLRGPDGIGVVVAQGGAGVG